MANHQRPIGHKSDYNLYTRVIFLKITRIFEVS